MIPFAGSFRSVANSGTSSLCLWGAFPVRLAENNMPIQSVQAPQCTCMHVKDTLPTIFGTYVWYTSDITLTDTLSARWKISFLFYFLLKRGRHVYKNVQNGVGVKSSYKVGDRPVMPSLNLPLGTIQYLIYVFI